MEENKECKYCGSDVVQEDRRVQFNRIKNSLSYLFPKDSDEKLEDYTRNFIGFGSNYMYVCGSCHKLTKIIPDGRRRY